MKFRPERIERNGIFRAFGTLALTALIFTSGCGGGGGAGAPASSGAPVASQKTASSGGSKSDREQARKATVALIRLNDPDSGKEPGLQSIEDGIKQAKFPYNEHQIVEYDAKGDLAAVPGLVDKALADGADVLVTLLDSTTMAVMAKNPPKPVVFAMANDPVGLGLGKSLTDHASNVTGAFLPHRLTLTVEIARGSLKDAKKFGILFDPDNKLSVIHKDNLLKCNWAQVEAVPVPYGKDTDWAKLADDLKAKGIAALILTNGLGNQSAKVIAEATRVKISVWGTLEKQAEEGAIFTREPAMRWTGFEVGRRIGRIVNGDEASKIPFVEGDHYTTVVNTKAAKDIGVTILPSIMRDIKDVSKPNESAIGGVRQ